MGDGMYEVTIHVERRTVTARVRAASWVSAEVHPDLYPVAFGTGRGARCDGADHRRDANGRGYALLFARDGRTARVYDDEVRRVE